MKAVILTKSDMTKQSTGKRGACVTAYEPFENRFVRFVSDEHGSPIPGFRFNLLDVVSVDVLRPCPLEPQTENLLVNPHSFSRTGHCQSGIEYIYFRYYSVPRDLPRFMDAYGNRLDSVRSFHHSLELIRVSELCLVRTQYDNERAQFRYNGRLCKYFNVTDPMYRNWSSKEKRSLNIGDACIVISIPTEPFESYGYFKFIAAIYPQQPAYQTVSFARF